MAEPGRAEWVRERLDTVIAELVARLPLRKGDRCTGDTTGPVVSIASYPGRSASLPKTVRSILRGRTRPARLIVLLAREQFPSGAPPALAALADRGVEVRWIDPDIRSYKKLLPLLADLGDRTIITADDDVHYPRGWLESLLAGASRSPGAVVGLRGTVMQLSSPTSLAPYRSWPDAGPQSSGTLTFLKGYGGILYPPGSLDERAGDAARARELAPTADDVWFKAMSLLAGTPVHVVAGPARLPSFYGSQAESLMGTNVAGGENDRALSAVFGTLDLWERLRGE